MRLVAVVVVLGDFVPLVVVVQAFERLFELSLVEVAVQEAWGEVGVRSGASDRG